jgi:hypothetical protein
MIFLNVFEFWLLKKLEKHTIFEFLFLISRFVEISQVKKRADSTTHLQKCQVTESAIESPHSHERVWIDVRYHLEPDDLTT